MAGLSRGRIGKKKVLAEDGRVLLPKHAVIPRFANPESAPSSPRIPRRIRAQSARAESRPARGRGGRGPARIRIRAGIRAGARVRTCNLSQFLTII